MKANFPEAICPVCGEFHQIKYSYRGVLLLGCDKLEGDQMCLYNLENMTIGEPKFLAYKTGIIEIHKGQDGLWYDKEGTLHALQEDVNSTDPIVRCGVGALSLSKDSKYTAGCAPHDFAYTSKAYQLFHTREEADDYLRRNTTLLGSAFLGRLFRLISNLWGGRFWENKKTR